jgi:hypothetical protein
VCILCCCRWAESELLESLTRLELGLSGHVEAWKVSRWAAKLEQLKQRNDALADGMAAAVRRLAASEDCAQEAQLRCEMTEVRQKQLDLSLHSSAMHCWPTSYHWTPFKDISDALWQLLMGVLACDCRMCSCCYLAGCRRCTARLQH